jgi:hypothetical protein
MVDADVGVKADLVLGLHHGDVVARHLFADDLRFVLCSNATRDLTSNRVRADAGVQHKPPVSNNRVVAAQAKPFGHITCSASDRRLNVAGT